jgi:hypothetical protein
MASFGKFSEVEQKKTKEAKAGMASFRKKLEGRVTRIPNCLRAKRVTHAETPSRKDPEIGCANRTHGFVSQISTVKIERSDLVGLASYIVKVIHPKCPSSCNLFNKSLI